MKKSNYITLIIASVFFLFMLAYALGLHEFRTMAILFSSAMVVTLLRETV